MLKQIHSVQVPHFWEIIKFAAIKSDNIESQYYEIYCIKLLQDLLSGKKYCFVASKDEKIIFIIILSFKFNEDTGMKYLYFNNLYAFTTQTETVWQEVFIDMSKIAQTAECKAIIGDSSNEQIGRICSAVGVNCISSKYAHYF